MGVVATLLVAAPAFANDSTAELGTGGLDFVRNENVEMRSEQLSISTAEIRVTYHFFNKSERPVTNLVAFPMPDITIADEDANISVPTEDPANFLAFTTQANGQPVDIQVEQKAFAKGLDRTAMLQEMKIPLAPHLRTTYAALDALPRDEWRQLIDLGLAEIAEYATGPDYKMHQHLEPRWTLKTTYYWQQTFPAQQELVIEHRYKPSVGGSAGTTLSKPDDPDARAEEKKYCMEQGVIDRAREMVEAARKAKNSSVGERRIDYVLKTGANWAGPIADFMLTLDKGAPDNLMSFCGKNGLKKLSPTQFQLHYTDFTPTRDLAILILTPKIMP
ncbi:MAG TPA: DUF4424 domain-containing protein [Stellaceae bacterium]|nr:DUF4424 domain-containing protein [Stellaceae bacterium]